MAIVTTDNTNYTNIAAAIRAKNGTETQYTPSEMAAAITALPLAAELLLTKIFFAIVLLSCKELIVRISLMEI